MGTRWTCCSVLKFDLSVMLPNDADLNHAAANLSKTYTRRAFMTEAVNKPYDMRIDLPKDQHFPLAVAHLSMNNFSGLIFVQGRSRSSPCLYNPVLSPQPQFVENDGAGSPRTWTRIVKGVKKR